MGFTPLRRPWERLTTIMGTVQEGGDKLRFVTEQRVWNVVAVMKELPERRSESCKRARVKVDSGSLIYADRNVYSPYAAPR
jgi:hypothetical protein